MTASAAEMTNSPIRLINCAAGSDEHRRNGYASAWPLMPKQRRIIDSGPRATAAMTSSPEKAGMVSEENDLVEGASSRLDGAGIAMRSPAAG